MNFNPPRTENTPIAPLPQTVSAVLEHSGLPTSALEMITDIPPDFSWMSEYQLYKGSFEMHVTDDPKSVLYSTNVGSHVNSYKTGIIEDVYIIPWNYLPFLSSRWWTGEVSYKFIAIKGKPIVGKILIRYAFDASYDFDTDNQRRNISVEWDLAESSEISFDVNSVFPAQQRPTWIPKVDYKDAVLGVVWAPQKLPYPQWYMGRIQVEVAQKLTPGSLYPDNIRILVFMVYKNTSFYLPTDMRGNSAHILALPEDDITWNSN